MNRNRNWNQQAGLRGLLGCLFVCLVALVGCGGSKAGTGIATYYGNYHAAGWIDTHPGSAIASIDTCTRCHEISVLKVGSGIPTCMTTGCHHQAAPGWAGAGIHGVKAKAAATTVGGSLVSCQICHAKDFSGGGSANACVTCHGAKAPHPVKPWRVSGGSVLSHATTDPSNAVTCAQCHYLGSPNNPAGHPSAPAPANTQPGCYNATLCHGANTAPHPVPFLAGQTDTLNNGHLTATATAFTTDCATCHAYTGTAPMATAPLCITCHRLADPVSTGKGSGTCLSCHAGTGVATNGPSGPGFPSIAGAHAKHMALATALTCDTCHAGSGAGTAIHYTNANARISVPTGPVPVSMDAIYTAMSGVAPAYSPTALTCSNVSCHGGQLTPGWQNGTINSSTQCTVCHAVAASAGTITQFNDAFGRHSLGTHDATKAANSITCTTCHNMANGSQGALAHFKYLDTRAVDGTGTGTPADQLPGGTIVFEAAIQPGTYTVTSATQGNGTCALTCHTHVHTGPLDTWQSSGAPHAVPFLATSPNDTAGNGHLTATATVFTTDCGTCHGMAVGASPSPGAPACMVCHTLADPTATATGASTCLSCHVGAPGLPAGPTGSAVPSIAGSHPKHMGLPTTLTCNSCHVGSGTGTAIHYANANTRNGAPTGPGSVAIDATFNAQSGGSASFNPTALTCGAVSCHGGQVSPNWRTGTIVSTTQCSVCHAINGNATTSQYNDAIGRHAWGTHASAGTLDCTICHDMSSANTSNGAVKHFAELNDTAVSSTNKLPSETIKFKLTNATYPITGGAATYTITATNKEGDGGCALTCHSATGAAMTHEPVVYHWKAAKGSGIAHPSPFRYADLSTGGNSHQTVTSAQFTAECKTCHDENNPASTQPGPTCTKCHTAGSPLAAGKTAGTCLSCHVGANFGTQGPSDTTAAWPSLVGSHPKHLALATFTRATPALPGTLAAAKFPACEACHVGSVPGDASNTHYSNANKLVTSPKLSAPGAVGIDPTFNSQGSTAGFTSSATAFTCSNISCHGGQTTPGWQTGSNPVNTTTYCIACHKTQTSSGGVVTNPEFNDLTGRHTASEHKQTCDYCHSMTVAKPGAQNHFKYLDTSAVSGISGTPADQLPSDTILFGSVVTGSKTYTPTTAGRGGCALACHGKTHTTSGNIWN